MAAKSPDCKKMTKMSPNCICWVGNIDFSTFPPPTENVEGWPIQLLEVFIASIDAKSILYSLTNIRTYNTRAFSSMVGETFFSEVTNQEKHGGHGTLTAAKFEHFMGCSIEQMSIRLDSNSSHHILNMQLLAVFVLCKYLMTYNDEMAKSTQKSLHRPKEHFTEFRKNTNQCLSWCLKNSQSVDLELNQEQGPCNKRCESTFQYQNEEFNQIVENAGIKKSRNHYLSLKEQEEKTKKYIHIASESRFFNSLFHKILFYILQSTLTDKIARFFNAKSSFVSTSLQCYKIFSGIAILAMVIFHFTSSAQNGLLFIHVYVAIISMMIFAGPKEIDSTRKTNGEFQNHTNESKATNQIVSNTQQKVLKRSVLNDGEITREQEKSNKSIQNIINEDNRNNERQETKHTGPNECENTVGQEEIGKPVSHDVFLENSSIEADGTEDIKSSQHYQLQAKLIMTPADNQVEGNVLECVLQDPVPLTYQSIVKCLCNTHDVSFLISGKCTLQEMQMCISEESSDKKQREKLFHAKEIIFNDVDLMSAYFERKDRVSITECMYSQTDVMKSEIEICIRPDAFYITIDLQNCKIKNCSCPQCLTFTGSCLTLRKPCLMNIPWHFSENTFQVRKHFIDSFTNSQDNIDDKKFTINLEVIEFQLKTEELKAADLTDSLKHFSCEKDILCKETRPHVISENVFGQTTEVKKIKGTLPFEEIEQKLGYQNTETMSNGSLSIQFSERNFDKKSKYRISRKNVTNDERPNRTYQINLNKFTENEEKSDWSFEKCKCESREAALPKLLEIRATGQEREKLIRELSDSFFTDREYSKNKESVLLQVSNLKDRILLGKDIPDNYDNEMKICKNESNPWYLRWRVESFQHKDKSISVYPISQYFKRIATFANWPKESPISAIRLAEAGFFYKGEGQLVECFSCHLLIAVWKKGDIPMEIHIKLSPDCSFLQEKEQVSGNLDYACAEENKNLPLPEKYSVDISQQEPAGATGFQSDLPEHFRSALSLTEQPNPIASQRSFDRFGYVEPENSENQVDSPTMKNPGYESMQARLESFRAWSFHEKQSPRALVDAGFYFLGKDDTVRCFCCDIGLAEWDTGDDPWVEHARHSPECSYVKKERGEEFINSIQESWRQIYLPKHPHLADYHIRLETFTSWPEHMEQRPPTLCHAGFFFTGEEDVVRCHYCDGGLRQWESGDDPWIEHARWFPFCKYIVKIKGLAFIEDVSRRYNEIYSNNEVEEQLIDTNYRTDYQRDSIPRTENLLQEPQSADSIRYALDQGYSLQNVMMAIEQFSQFNRRRNFTASDLIDIITERERIGDLVPDNNMTPFIGGHAVDNQPSKALADVIPPARSEMEQLDNKQLAVVNTQLKNQLLCSNCHIRESGIVLTPCGHRVLCDDCSTEVERCPKCHQEIQNRIKTFLA